MTRKTLARRIAELLFNEPATRRGAGAAPTRRAARILAGCFVARRLKTTAGILPPRAAHPAKIRSSAAIPASDLVHYELRSQELQEFRSFRMGACIAQAPVTFPRGDQRVNH